MAEKLDPNAIADDGNDIPGHQSVDEDMIHDYVMNTGQLPGESAEPFASWANEVWFDFNDGSGTMTNGQIIAGMLAYWRGK